MYDWVVKLSDEGVSVLVRGKQTLHISPWLIIFLRICMITGYYSDLDRIMLNLIHRFYSRMWEVVEMK